MGSPAVYEPASNSDGLAIGACKPAAKNATGLSPLLALAEARVAPSSSSVAGRLRLPPHISSRKFGGEASIGTRLSTVPSEGRNQPSPLPAKPRSRSWAARTARAWPEVEPSTTAISRLPLRVADPTRLYPEAQMKPVLKPSAPA